MNDEIPIYEEMTIFKKHLILSGGGIKGIAHIGVLFALQEIGCLDKIETFVGTSIGSLVMSLFVLGYSPTELYDFIKLFDLKNLKNMSISNIPQFGLDTGSRIEYVIQRMIKVKNHDVNITLKELYEKTKKKLVFTTVCVNDMEIKYISYETHPKLQLYLAIRMSISLPFIYIPVKYENNYYIDGGCFDNFPINVFKSNDILDLDQVVGILLMDSKDKMETIDNLESYILRVLQCIMQGITYNAKKGFEKYTVEINIDSINALNFEIDSKIKDKVFMNGYSAVFKEISKFIYF